MNLAQMRRQFALEPALAMQIPPVGKVFYVNSVTGANSAARGTSWMNPLATIAYAISLCTASKGDVILVAPFHVETLTAKIDVNKIGVSIIGVRQGAQMPTLTGNGTIDVMDLTVAGCTVDNIRFDAPETNAQTADINIAAANCTVRNTFHIISKTAKVKTNVITITAAGHYAYVTGAQMYGTVVECSAAIAVEGVAAGVVIEDCNVFDTIGFAVAALSIPAVAVQIMVRRCYFSNVKTSTACINATGNPTGVIANCWLGGRNTTIASNIVTGNALNWFNNTVVEEVTKSGMLLPAVDAE